MAIARYSLENQSSNSKTFSLTIYASEINDWASTKIPKGAEINSVNLSFSAKKSALSNRGSITISVAGKEIFSASKVVDSTGWYGVNQSLKDYVQSGNANAGCISGDVHIYIDGPLRNVDWYVENIAIEFDYKKLPPEFTSAQMLYLDKQISETNRVICNEGFIISVGVT